MKIEIRKTFNAPVEDVWKIWTDPELIKRWWGPDKFVCPFAKVDFREGGKSLVSMRAPDEMGNREWYSVWNYVKIIPFEEIQFVQHLADKNGDKQLPTAVGMPADFPEDIKTVVTFKALSKNKTEMTVTEYADFGQTSHFAKIGLEQSGQKMMAIF